MRIMARAISVRRTAAVGVDAVGAGRASSRRAPKKLADEDRERQQIAQRHEPAGRRPHSKACPPRMPSPIQASRGRRREPKRGRRRAGPPASAAISASGNGCVTTLPAKPAGSRARIVRAQRSSCRHSSAPRALRADVRDREGAAPRPRGRRRARPRRSHSRRRAGRRRPSKPPIRSSVVAAQRDRRAEAGARAAQRRPTSTSAGSACRWRARDSRGHTRPPFGTPW